MRGIANEQKRRVVFENLRKNADILVLQETHSSVNMVNLWKNEWGGDVYFSHGSTNSRGVAVFLKKGFEIHNVLNDEDGRLIIFDIIENSVEITIAVVYAPNSDTPSFFTYLSSLLRNRCHNKIVIGDFNLVFDIDLDRLNTYNNNNRAREELLNIVEEFILKDVWRIQNETKKEFSWIKAGDSFKRSRIDFALVSAGLDHLVKSPMYLTGYQSDHRPFYMVVETAPSERGSGYWKFNNLLLKDKNFLAYMEVELTRTIQSCAEKSPMNTWESIKARIKKAAIQYAKMQASEEAVIISELMEKVIESESCFPLNEKENDLYLKTKFELEEKMLKRIQGVMFRSKVKWYEEGEKNTKYFFALEKARYNAKTCFKLLDEGIEIIDSIKILEKQKQFYQELYREDKHVNFNLENNFGIQVPSGIKSIQEKELAMEDISRALKSMKNGKTPGHDGITADFYKVFWKILQGPFLKMVKEVYVTKRLHDTARSGILNLIPKAGKDTRLIKNLRPIT